MDKTLYTLNVYSENIAGILNQITTIFTRRQLNIESLNVSASSIKGIHKYTITTCKIPTQELLDSNRVEYIVSRHNARIIEINPTYMVIQKSGTTEETQELYDDLKEIGILQFVRSGRIAITKSCVEKLSEYLTEREQKHIRSKKNCEE